MIRNFLFHRVNPERDPLWDPMDVKLFDMVLQYISKKYTTILFEELAFDEEAKKKKKTYATIMFDDGYKDNIEHALPILEKYNVKASFYVVTNCIDQNIPTWTHVLENAFQNTKRQEINLSFDFLPEKFQKGSFIERSDRLKFVAELKPFLKTIDHHKREEVLKSITDQFSDVDIPKLMMNWDDLRILRDKGHYVGSHTVNHVMLGTMQDEVEVEAELKESAKRIEEELGYFPKTISYPVGSFNQKIKDISKKLGYQIGLAVKQDVHDPTKEDLFEVSRIELYNEPWFKIRLRISNTLENIKKAIGYK